MPSLTSQNIPDPESDNSSQMSDIFANNPLSSRGSDSLSGATDGMRQGLQNDMQTRDNPFARAAEEKRSNGINDPFNTGRSGSSQYTGDANAIDENLQGLNALNALYDGNIPSGVSFSEHEYIDDHDGSDWVRGIGQLATGAGLYAGTRKAKTAALAYTNDSLSVSEKNNIGRIFERTSPSSPSRAEDYAKMEHTFLKKLDERAASDKFTPLSKLANKYETWRLGALERAAGEAPGAGKAAAKLGTKTLTQTQASAIAVHSGEKVATRFATKEGVRIATKEAGRGIGKGLATKILPRIGLTAVFPVGTAVSVALVALDPGVVNFIRKGIVEIFPGPDTPDMDTPPEPPRTYFLPLTHDGNRDPAIEDTDNQLVQVNNTTFTFEPDKVWPEDPAIQTTGTFDSYLELFNKMNDLVLEAVQGSYGPLQEFQEEQQVNKLLEARAPFIEAMTAMPVDLLQEVANESLYPIAGFSNAYTKFREIINRSRLTIHESGNADTWLGGLIVNPKDLFIWTKTLEADEMIHVAQEMKAAADEIDEGNQRLANIKFDWTFTEKSMQPVFGLSKLQENYSKGIDKQERSEQAEQEKEDRDLQPINHTTPTPAQFPSPRVPTTPIRTPRSDGLPGRNTDELKTPKIPDINLSPDGISTPTPKTPKPEDITNNLPKIDTTEPSKFNPAKLETPDTSITTPKTPKLDTETIKTDVSKSEPSLPNPSTVSPSGIKTPTSDPATTKLSQSPNLPAIDQTPKTTTGIKIPESPKTNPKNPKSPLNSQNLTSGVRGQTTTLPAASRTPNTSSGIKTPPSPGGGGTGGAPRGGIPTNPVKPGATPTNPSNTVQAGLGNPAENKNTPPPTDPAENEAPEAPEFEDNPTSGERETTTISRDGKTFDMGSGKAAKLAELINPTDGSAPISLREAMGEAGYDVPDPGANPGKPVSPMDLQPGDLVIGEKYQGIYVGDGTVLTSEGLKPLNEVAVFSGNDPNQGLFRPDASEVDAESAQTGQEASATQDFETGEESKSSGPTNENNSPRVSPGLGGLGHNGARAAMGNANAGKKASVTPGGDPFDPGGSKAASDPFERIAVTGTGGIGRSFGPNVPTGD